MNVRIGDEVGEALAAGTPVVGMESTITSELGLPAPANSQCLGANVAAVRELGAVPAITAVLDGEVRIGVPEAEHERLLGPAEKVAARDLPGAVGAGVRFGATTVSASLALCTHAGIGVLATGGIGGVHHGASDSGDVSADLDALAAYPVITVCSGAKAFLDLPRTFEALESRAVPVICHGCDEIPMFTARTSGLPAPRRLDDLAVIVAAFDLHRTLGGGGMLVCEPVPASSAVDSRQLRDAVQRALDDATAEEITGAAITPFVLARLAEDTGGASVDANLALARANAELAALLATELGRHRGRG